MEIVTRTDLSVSKTAAWNVLSNFPGWNSWNPAMRDICVERLEPGAKVTFKIKLGGGPLGATAVDADLLWVRSGEGFGWRGPRRGALRKVLSGEHWFMIERRGDTNSVLHHGERFTGALAGVLDALGAKRRIDALDASINQAFKAAAEAE